MSTEAALLRAIREEPDEDTPRLVYADYLDEAGQSARAEFIRLQVARAGLAAFDPARASVEDREHELLAEHECAWLGVAPDDTAGLAEWSWERGFVAEVAAAPDFVNGPGADLCAAHAPRSWRVMLLGNAMRADLNEAGRRTWATRIEAVDFTGWYPDVGECSGFLARAHLPRLRELDLTGRGPLDPVPDLIQYAPFRDQLEILSCGAAGYDDGRLDPGAFAQALGACRLTELAVPASMLTADDLLDLVAAPALETLKALDISSNPIDARGADAFRGARFRLHELDLSGTGLAGALQEFIGCPALRELRRLHLNRTENTADGISALAASAFWARGEELRMQRGTPWNPHGYEGDEPARAAEAESLDLDPLFAAAAPHLRILDLSGNNLRDAGVARLCAAAWAGSLAYLDLSQNHLTDEALRMLARCGLFKKLHTLHLNGNGVHRQQAGQGDASITDGGLRALAECPDLANLRVLSISGARITAAGLEAVLYSPHWKLSGLSVAHCGLRRAAAGVLAAAPGLSRLQVLDLSGNDDIGLSGLTPLAESEHLSPQTELNVRGVGDDSSAVRQAFEARLGRRFSL